MNNWGIPEDTENRVRARDRACVYCHVRLREHSPRGTSRRNVATWEHINNAKWNDKSIMDLNVVRCCGSCNSSKGTKLLLAWFDSAYCKDKGISAASVADPVKAFLKKYPKLA